jgi:hypothetical protein
VRVLLPQGQLSWDSSSRQDTRQASLQPQGAKSTHATSRQQQQHCPPQGLQMAWAQVLALAVLQPQEVCSLGFMRWLLQLLQRHQQVLLALSTRHQQVMVVADCQVLLLWECHRQHRKLQQQQAANLAAALLWPGQELTQQRQQQRQQQLVHTQLFLQVVLFKGLLLRLAHGQQQQEQQVGLA